MKDQELWVITGRTPVLWTVPFVVQWKDVDGEERAFVRYAIHLYTSHRKVVEELLNLHGKKESPHSAVWILGAQELMAIGEKTASRDPELCFSWGPTPIREPKEHKPDPNRKDLEETIEELYLAGMGKTKQEVHYWYNGICKYLMHRLTNLQKPVDLYFIKLHPTPYRANWKQILNARYPNLWRVVGRRNAHMRELALLDSGFMDELISLDLLAHNVKDGYCYRRVEVEHRTDWWRQIKRIEKQRLVDKGAFGYARSTMESVKRGLPVALRMYGAYLAYIALPSASYVEGERSGDYQLVAHVPRNRLRPQPAATDDITAVVSAKEPAFTESREPQGLPESNGELQELPDIQSTDEDVRSRWRQVLRTTDQVEETDRLSLLSPREEPNFDKLLAVRSNGAGMEKPVEQLPS